jgi:hypothetical protein
MAPSYRLFFYVAPISVGAGVGSDDHYRGCSDICNDGKCKVTWDFLGEVCRNLGIRENRQLIPKTALRDH